MNDNSRNGSEKSMRRVFMALVLLVLAILAFLMFRTITAPVSPLPPESPPKAAGENAISIAPEKAPEVAEAVTIPPKPEADIVTKIPEESQNRRELSPPSGYTKFQEPCSGEAGNAVELFIGIYTECEDQIYGYSIEKI